MVANSFFNFCFGRSTTAFPTSYKFIAYVVIVFILISTWHLCRYRSINKSKIQVRGLLIRKMGGGGGGCPLRCPGTSLGQRSGLPAGYTWEFCHTRQAAPSSVYWNSGQPSWQSATSKYEKVAISVENRVGCPWATRGNFAMQIRLPV